MRVATETCSNGLKRGELCCQRLDVSQPACELVSRVAQKRSCDEKGQLRSSLQGPGEDLGEAVLSWIPPLGR